MSTIPKRQHYNPQMLLRRFTDNQGKLFFFDKSNPRLGVRTSRTENVFVQNHLYTIESKDGIKDTSLESAFAAMESKANIIIEKIVTSARMGHEPSLSPEERQIFDSFFYYQWKRVPELIESNSSVSDFDNTFRRAISAFDKSIRRLSESERRDLLQPATIKRIRQTAIVRAVADPGSRVLNELAKKGLGIFITRKAKKSFAIGSRAIVKLTHRGLTHLSDPSVEVWLPIAFDVAICLTSGSPKERLLECSDDQHIRHLNRSIFKQSRIVAGRSYSLVASLSGCR